MSTLDQFESAFRSASKDTFSWAPPAIARVLVVTDLDADAGAVVEQQMRKFLAGMLAHAHAEAAGLSVQWRLVTGDEFSRVDELLELVSGWTPDLICTYRNLHSSAKLFEVSLGESVQVLTQTISVPVLLIPHPEQDQAASHTLHNTDVVMAMTDHLTGSERLVNFAAAMTQPEGKLWLTHVEDELVYDRFIEVISKIPQIETDLARELIGAKLLQEPTDYVETCRGVINRHRPQLTVEPLVAMGHHLSAYRQLVSDHDVDLLVINTKDDDQLAMHGMAYPIAVEIRDIPLLLL